MEVLSEMRAPTRKDEAWRFTDLSRVYTKAHSTSPLADPAATLDPQLVRSFIHPLALFQKRAGEEV
jgi:hypothetical protein